MRKLYALLFTVVLFAAVQVNAQITVTVAGNTNTTPNLAASYTSLANALTDLNAVSAMTGPVTLTLGAGTSETAPATGLTIGSATLNPVLSSTNSVTIVKASGTVTLNAGVGIATPISAVPDGILKLVGADYITIDGLTLTDGNATNPATMEFAVGLFKRAAGDGCNNNTIQNCVFNLPNTNNATATAPMIEGSVAILVINSIPTTATTSLTPTNGGTLATNGTNSNNKFYSNTINGGNYGIGLSGFAATAGVGPAPTATTFLGDLNNDIGGNALATGNTILNFGGVAGATLPAAGIRANNQWSLNISYNTVNNNNGSGSNHVNIIRGIFAQAGTSANVTIRNNNVTVKAGGTTTQLSGIENAIGSTAAANTATITNNNVTAEYNSATTTAVFYPIFNSASAATVNILSNKVSNTTYGSSGSTGTGVNYLIYNTGAATNLNIIGDTVINHLRVGTTGGIIIGIFTTTGTNQTVKKNFVNNLGIDGTGTTSTVYGIQTSTGTVVCDSNIVKNLKCIKTTGTSPMYGMYNIGSPTNENYNFNLIDSLTNAGTGITYGLFTNTTTGVRTVSNNVIRNVSSNGLTNAGMNMLSSSPSIFKNKIHNISSTNTGAAAVSGIILGSLGTSGVARIYNNLISDLYAPNANSLTLDLVRGINITSTSAGNVNVYFNTINLNATSSGLDFSTSGIYHASSASAGTSTLDLRNNIIVNTSTATGGGTTAAFRRNGGTTANSLNNFATTSNYNLFYVGIPVGNNYIYSDGTNSAATIGDYQSFTSTAGNISPRESASVSDDPEFQSVDPANANFLKYKTSSAKPCESGGINISGITDDNIGTIRQGNAGYAGTGSAPDMGAWELNGIGSFTCTTPNPGATVASATNLCLGNSSNLGIQNATPGTGVSYQWQSSTNGTSYSNISGANGTSYTATPTAATFYRCAVTCQNGPVTVNSTAVQLVFANGITSKTDSTRCGTGSVVLKATGNSGTTIKWYTDSIGGASIGSGSPFSTPVISATTTYYVGAEQSAPATVTLGAGSLSSISAGISFLPGAWGGAKTQYIIRASELNAIGLGAGNFSSLGFEPTTSGQTYQGFYVNIGQTSNTTAPTATFIATGLTQVYAGTDPDDGFTPTAGVVNTLTFGTGAGSSPTFTWDGVSNIVVSISWSRVPAAATATGSTMKYDAVSFVSTAYRQRDNLTPTAMLNETAVNLTTSNRPIFFIDGIAVCSSPRKAVTATVTTAATLTITANQTVCNNSVATLSVTSNLPDYNTYKWTPTTNLFTDAACTVPYVSGASATTVYVKSAAADTTVYSCTSNNTTSLCSNLATTKVTTLPATPTVAATTSKQQCLSGSTTFALTPSTGYGAATIQWQSSLNNTSFSDVSGANAVTYTTPILSTTTYYRVMVKIGATTCTTSNADTIIVNNPSILTTTDSVRCGTGTVNLRATASAGATLNWYTDSLGGSPVASGTLFTTPTITTTTPYYVAANSGGSSSYIGAPNTSVAGFSGPSGQNTTTGAGIIFDVLNPNGLTINSVDVYPTGPIGSVISIGVFVGTSTTPVVSYTTTTTVSGTTGAPVVQTVPVNFIIPAGTGYQMRQHSTPAPTSLLIRYSLTTWQTYTVPGTISLTGSVLSGFYYYFYNWLVSTGCESAPRRRVTANVTAAPAITITPASINRCPAETPTSMTASSTASFNYTWSPNTELSSATGATITTSATASRTYTVTGNDGAGCVNTKQIIVTVKAAPSAITITPASSAKCATDTVTLTASGGTVSNVTILSEGFESGATGWTFEDSASTGTAVSSQIWRIQPAPYTDPSGSITFSNFSVTGSNFAYANADAGGSGSFTRTFMTSNSFSTVGFVGDATLTFKNLYRYWASSSPIEQVKVQITTDNGVTWNDLINYSGADVGTTTNNAQVPVTSTITVPAIYMGQSSVKLRWRYLSNWGYVWVVDDVSLTGNASTTFAWTPATALTTTSGTVVKTFASSPITYTVISTNPSTSCTSSNTVAITINPNTSIAYVSGGNIQTVNLGRSINLIKYKVTNATGSSSVGLPAGVTAVLTADTIRITGTPTAVGVYNYKVIGTGLCRPDTLSGTITVDSCTIDWGNTQWPPSGTINNCGNYSVYAQVYKAGYTEAPGAAVGMQAWIGISTTNSNPSTWPESNWKLASFNTQAGNNDEFTYNFSNLDTGNYFIASRYKLPCSNFYYGGYNSIGGGAWNGTANTSVTLRVNAIPAPVSGGNQTQCQQSPIQTLTATATGSNVTWWTAASGGTKVTSPTLNSVGTITYYAQDSTSGCNSLARTAVTLKINPLPTISSLTGSGTICKGDSLLYTINFTGTAPWTFVVTNSGGSPNDTITTSSNPFMVWDNAEATETYTIVKLTDATGCVSSGTLASGTTTVTVVNPPTSGGNQTQCQQSPIQTLTATATGSNVTWWTAASGGTKVTSPTLNTVGTITYFARDSANGCKSLTRTAVTLTINANPAAVAVTPNSASQCTNSSAQKLKAIGGVGAGTYVWTPTSGLFTDAAATTPYSSSGFRDSVYARPGSTTKYTATSTNSNTCSSMDTSNIIVNCTLPVSYLNFAGVKEPVGNVLRWTTSTEQNNKGFDVERSVDGRTFSSLGFVNSKGDNGNSNYELSYSFIDNQLSASVYYYRLRQVDLNGKTSYSNTIVIKGDRVSTIKMSGLYPNPATEEVTITIDAPNAEKVVLIVTDIYGKQLLQQNISVEVGSNNTKLNVGRLAAGTYLVKLISSKSNEGSTLKFVKY